MRFQNGRELQNLGNFPTAAGTFDTAKDLPTGIGQAIPAAAVFALIVSEVQAIRYTDAPIPVPPTAGATGTGIPLAVNEKLNYDGQLALLLIIAQVAGAKVTIAFYG